LRACTAALVFPNAAVPWAAVSTRVIPRCDRCLGGCASLRESTWKTSGREARQVSLAGRLAPVRHQPPDSEYSHPGTLSTLMHLRAPVRPLCLPRCIPSVLPHGLPCPNMRGRAQRAGEYGSAGHVASDGRRRILGVLTPVGHFAGHAGSDGSDPFSRLSRHGFAHPTSPTSAPGLGLARATSAPGLTGEWLETAGENIDLGNIEASHIV